MRRPAVGLALVFGGGIGLGLPLAGMHAPAFARVFLALLAAWGLAVGLCASGRYRRAAFLVFLLTGLLGFLLGAHPPGGPGLDALPETADGRIACRMGGTVLDEPGNATPGREGRRSGQIRFAIRTQWIETDGRRHAVSDVVKVTLFGVPSVPPAYGEHWILDGVLEKRLWKGTVHWRFRAGRRHARRLERGRDRWSSGLQAVRRRAASVLGHGIESQTDVTGVVSALLLGYRARLPADTLRSFTRTGTLHVFAISGLHVAILCSVLVFAAGLLRMPRSGYVLALGPLMLLYAFTTGGRPSAVRAGLMAGVYMLAPALGRRADPFSALALAGMLILAFQPAQLTDAGFIFSFAVVAGILVIVPVLDTGLRRALAPDPFLPPDVQAPGRWWRLPLLWLGRMTSVSLAAWLTSMPLSLLYFGRFAPIALVANLLVTPLAFLIILTACLSLLSAALAGLWLAAIFNSANVVFVRLLTGGIGLLERVPYGHVEGVFIPPALVAIWYVLLALGVSGVFALPLTSPDPDAGRPGEDV